MSSSTYVQLLGDNWASRSAGFLAIELTTGLVLAGCLLSVHSFTWAIRGKPDKFSTSAFILATLSAIIYFVLDLTNEGEQEDDAIISYHYFVLYVFSQLFLQIAEFAILVAVARTVNLLSFYSFVNPAPHRAVRLLPFVFVGVVAVVSITSFAFFAAYYSYLSNGLFRSDIANAMAGSSVAYGTVYTTTSLYIAGNAIVVAARERSKVSFLTILAAISLLLRSIFYLVDMAVGYYSSDQNVVANVNWAVSYLYDIITVVIYLGVMGVALMRNCGDPMPKTDSTIELSPSTGANVS